VDLNAIGDLLQEKRKGITRGLTAKRKKGVWVLGLGR